MEPRKLKSAAYGIAQHRVSSGWERKEETASLVTSWISRWGRENRKMCHQGSFTTYTSTIITYLITKIGKFQKYHKIPEIFQKYHTCIFQFLPYDFGSNSAPCISWLLEGTLSSPSPGAMKLFTEEDFSSQDTFLTASHAHGNLRRSPAEPSRVFPAGLISLSDHKQQTSQATRPDRRPQADLKQRDLKQRWSGTERDKG